MSTYKKSDHLWQEQKSSRSLLLAIGRTLLSQPFLVLLDDATYIMVLTVLDLPTCQGDLPGKKSQLDLRSFGVGVLAVGCKVMP